MAWKTVAKPTGNTQRKKRKVNLSSGYGGGNSWSGTVDNYNMIQQVYRGRYDRLERYKLYDWMDQDSDISKALDLIGEHCTDKNDDGLFWNFDWSLEPTDEESALINENVKQWSKINEWNNRMFRVIRNVVKYGDWFLFRNPETFELYSIHPKFVLGALIDREKLEIVAWIVRNFKFNVENLELAVDNQGLQDRIKGLGMNSGVRNTKVIPAIHMMHLSLSEGKFAGSSSDDDPSDKYNNRWPFGESWLEQASKTFKQRELLEDAFLIHRVQRAPSRTIWYIDTGKQRADRASWAVHNFKNELNQKRIPQVIGSEQKTVDSVYNPISQLEDIYIPVSFDQRGSKVETLEGQPWENIPDLDYFTKKMISALRVPRSWMLGANEGGSLFNDGRVGVAYQEEIEFSKFCTRIQINLVNEFDFEFKLYSKMRDVNVSSSDFSMMFVEPDNYEDYKRNARDQDNINTWSSIKDDPTISKRFARKKYLNWTDDETVENERMVIEERGSIEDASNAEDVLGGGGFGGGALPPMGPEMGLPGDIGSGEIGTGGMTGMGEIGAMGGDAGAAGGVMSGAVGGVGESEDKNMKMKDLMEAGLTSADIAPQYEKSGDENEEQTPDDKLFNIDGFYAGSEGPIGDPIATLKMLGDIRKTQMSRRVEKRKRLKMIQQVYKSPDEGGGAGGFGGGMGF